MKGATARAKLAGAASLARSLHMAPTRAERFLHKRAEPALALEELSAWPQWPREPEAEQARIFAVAALLASGRALADEICGEALRGYAYQVGESLLEDVLATPAEGGAPLPPPGMLASAGEVHAQRALPRLLAERLGRPGTTDGVAAHYVAKAEALVSRAPHWGGRA